MVRKPKIYNNITMREPEPMRQIHEIRLRMYEETKHMSTKEYLEYIQKNAKEVEKRRKKLKRYTNLEAFFTELNKKRKAG